MTSRPLKTCLVGLFALGAGVGVYGQSESVCVPPPAATFQTISRSEIESMLADVARTNPKVIDGLREDPELKRAQIDNLQELLAFAHTAVKEGHAAKTINCVELGSIRDEVTAVAYDKEKNKGKGNLPAFGFITKPAIAAYWGTTPAKALSSSIRKEREDRFRKFIDTKFALLTEGNPDMAGREITGEEVELARDLFAKIQIYADEYAVRSATLPASFREKVNLQVKLQQAQFLARRYSEVVAAKTVATDEEIRAFISADPALNTDSKRAKAEQIFARAKKGEDFAALANEFSEDPGNKDDDGKFHGGIYRDVKKGVMIPAFEQAAWAVEAGQVYPALVETDFGFHVVKLERKDTAAGVYDVRHILISTTIEDPENTTGNGKPVKAHARASVEGAKQKKLVDSLVAENNITVAEDFSFPSTSPVKAPVKRVAKPAAKPAARRTVRKRS